MATPSERALAARLAAHESWARTTDRSARTESARQAFRDRFEREVDPDGILAPAERARRAANARKAFYTRLALKSAQSRRKAAQYAREAAEADAALSEADAFGGDVAC